MASGRAKSVLSEWARPDASPAFGAKPTVKTEALVGRVITGRLDLHPDGFGFLIAKEAGVPNIYVGEESLNSVMNRDEVRVRVDRAFEGGGKLRGTCLAVVNRAQKEFLGAYRPYRGGALVVPLDARDRKHAFKIVPGEFNASTLKTGAAVLCRVHTYPDKGQGSAEILNTVEDPLSPSQDTLRILLEAGWPREFTRAALGEAELRARKWQSELRPTRKDLRKLPLVTIDGRDAKDFDDAVCAQKEGRDIRLWVAIADVSHFVQTGSALDREAFARSTSVYFPDHVVPMLPEILSNGVCSLNPLEDRACMVCEMKIGPKGEVLDFSIYEGLMKSRKRMTYEDMQMFIDGTHGEEAELGDLSNHLTDLVEVYRRLRAERDARGSIDLDIPEAKILMNKDGTILDIQPRERLEAHRLIEECMLAANSCTAQFLFEKGEGVYRIHEQPDPLKVADLSKFLATAGFDIKDLEAPGDFARVMERVQRELGPQDPTARAISILVLRSLKQARYSSERLGHFALATADYTHFTSPIRRYPDLMVHRLLKKHLGLERFPAAAGMELEDACRHSSDQERLAMDCERKVIETKKCRYLEKHLGEEFDAMVTGIIEKGIFCQLDGHFVDGLLSAEALHRAGRYRFDPLLMQYVGPGKTRLSLGDRIRVVVAAVDPIARKIDFGWSVPDEEETTADAE